MPSTKKKRINMQTLLVLKTYVPTVGWGDCYFHGYQEIVDRNMVHVGVTISPNP